MFLLIFHNFYLLIISMNNNISIQLKQYPRINITQDFKHCSVVEFLWECVR